MKSPKSSAGSFKLSGKFTLLLIALIFFLTMTTFAFNEVIRTPQDAKGDERKASVIQILMNSLKSDKDERSKLLLINVEHQNDTQKLISLILSTEEAKKLPVPERKTREAVVDKAKPNSTQALKISSSIGSNRDNRGYYEEQRAVVVHAESAAPIVAQRQPPYGPPRGEQDSEERPLQPEDRYYDEQEASEGDYANESEQGGYYQPDPARYYPDSREQYAREEEEAGETPEQQRSTVAEEQQQDEGRASQQRQYDAYYRQWHYATTTSPPVSGNRKLQPMHQPVVGDRNRDPYANYEENPSDYDYQPAAPARPQQSQQYNPQYRPQQALPQSSTQPANSATSALKPRPTSAASTAEPTYLSVMKSIKTMWDIYQAFSTAWSALAEHHQKQIDQQQQQQKLKRQQLSRINSKKPPKFENGEKAPQKNNSTTKATKTTKTPTKLNTTTASKASDASSLTTALPTAKTESRKGVKGDAAARRAAAGLRMKRDFNAGDEVEAASSSTAEGRYIKGDPLKGYYDFVITEGSYKFWAVFQVGTALLIIYSTFAAIYYSKVNPLVSDYDYTDYLGGSRALSGGDLDFVDDGEEGATPSASKTSTASVSPQNWNQWGTRAGHSLQFILEAIDKLPSEEHVTYEAAKEQPVGNEEVEPHA